MGTNAADRWATAGTGLVGGAVAGFLARDLDLPNLASYWGDRTPLVVVAAALGSLLWGTRLRPLLAAFALGLAALWLVVAFTPLSAVLAEGLPRRDAPAPADAVFVLASRLQDDGDPTAPALSRLVHGLELIGERRAPGLILSELPPPSRSYAAVARTLMAHLGIEAELVTVGPVASTREEAVAVGALCRHRGWNRLLVVTSPLHTRRASAVLEREGLEVVSSPAVETLYDLETLARPDNRLFAFGSVLHERLGLWVYARRGWLERSSRTNGRGVSD